MLIVSVQCSLEACSGFAIRRLCLVPVRTEANDLVIDTLALEATKEYQEKMGRWRKKALNIASDTKFWNLMTLMHRARQPLIHYSSFLKSRKAAKGKSIKLSDSFNAFDATETKIVKLVSFKCQEIMAELFDLLKQPLLTNCMWVRDDGTVVDFKWLFFRVICRHACQFNRRIVQPTLTYPGRLFLLVASKPGVKCQNRKIVATELVAVHKQLEAYQQSLCGPSSVSRRNLQLHPMDNVNNVVAKLVGDPDFIKELVGAADTGTLDSKPGGLYSLISSMAHHLKVDVTQNERVNKLLSMLGEHCPNASLVSWNVSHK